MFAPLLSSQDPFCTDSGRDGAGSAERPRRWAGSGADDGATENVTGRHAPPVSATKAKAKASLGASRGWKMWATTLPKTNIDPDNGNLEDCFPLPANSFQDPC